MYKGFTQVELKKPERSTFDLSHEKRVSSRIGRLTPVLITETLPNDTFYGSTEVLIKVAPMVAPIFHRLNLTIYFFFIPMRLLWKDWETFITGGRLGEAVTTPPVPPFFNIHEALNFNEGLLDTSSVADYLGIPNIPDADIALWTDRGLDLAPFAAFYKCWYDYYRDRNYVEDNESLPLSSGYHPVDADIIGGLRTKQRAWQHDYFTSALTQTQRGQEVLLPLQGSGFVTYDTTSRVFDSIGGNPSTGAVAAQTGDLEAPSGNPVRIENIDGVTIDNSEVSINDFRRAVALQSWLERNALAGSRYNESIMAHFARKTSDSRLQRAEYLGGGKAVIQISEVLTTAFSEDADANVIPPAQMSGRGSSYSNTNKFSYNCEEHGFIVGILTAMPTSSYMQGIPRMFRQRNEFLDYPWPSFAHLGEQEVYAYELFADPATTPVDRTSAAVWGYQSRYSDWKNIPSSSHGDFRTSLDFWHLTRKFDSLPNLGNEFVEFEDELQDRIFAVGAGVDNLWMYIYNDLKVKRSLPYFGTPKIVG